MISAWNRRFCLVSICFLATEFTESTKCLPTRYPATPLLPTRGGGFVDQQQDEHDGDEESVILDAYIEDLLASVSDTDQEEVRIIKEDDDGEEVEGGKVVMAKRSLNAETQQQQQQQPHVNMTVFTKEGSSSDELESEEKQKQEEEEDGVKVVNRTISLQTQPQPQESANTDVDSNNTSSGGNGTPEINGTVTAATDSTDSTTQTTTTREPGLPSQSTDTQTPTASSVSNNRIPNPLFRFLLHRGGKPGHVVVMMGVLWLEWLSTYFPVMAASLDWIYVHTLPKSIREPKRLLQQQGQQGRRGRGGKHGRPMTSTAKTTLERTGASRKKRRELTRQADQAALEQLKQLKSNARYQHVSVAFLQRHRLGPYQKEDDEVEVEEPNNDGVVIVDMSDQETVAKKKKKGTKKHPQKSSSLAKKPVDWVVQALTQDRSELTKKQSPFDQQKQRSSAKTSKTMQPTITLELGSNKGLSVGLEFGSSTRDKYRKTVVQAVAQEPPAPPLSRRRQTPSDPENIDGSSGTTTTKDAANGFMGKIRAVAGSSVSRSLLGAYPGDAVPVREAADTHGLRTLAERYGYRDLFQQQSEKDDDEFGSMTKRTRKRKKQQHDGGSKLTKTAPRRRSTFSETLLDYDRFGDKSGPSNSANDSNVRKSRQRTTRTDAGAATTATARNAPKSATTTTPRRVSSGKSEAKKHSTSPSPKIEKTLPTRPSSNSVQPAMSRLNELRARAKNNEDSK